MGKNIGSLISRSKTYYYSIKSIYSDKLGQNIVFNRYGWKHLLYDSSDRRRTNKDIELRLLLLREAKSIILKTKFPIIITSKDTEQGQVQTRYFELYDKSQKLNRFIKVIVRQIGSGNYHYFSIRRSKRNKKPV